MLKILSVQIYDFEKYGNTFCWVLFHDFRAIVFEHVLLLFCSLNVRRRLTNINSPNEHFGVGNIFTVDVIR
jgi:hypothetical protein